MNYIIGPHYHGNFWWSKSSYIKTLPRNIGPDYLDPEAWLLKNITENKHIDMEINGDYNIVQYN